MQFKIWLESNEYIHSPLDSWLDPNGKFHPTNDHLSMAKEILKTNDNNAMQNLFKLKWQKVIQVIEDIVSNNNFYPPNYIQKQALIDLALSEKLAGVYYDNGSDEFPVWTSEDQI